MVRLQSVTFLDDIEEVDEQYGRKELLTPLRKDLGQYPQTGLSTPDLRWQLRQRLFDLFLGTATNAPAVFVFDMLNLNSPYMQLTNAAMDTLSFAQMATTFTDTSMAAEARAMYGREVQTLRAKFSPEYRMEPANKGLEDIIAGLHALALCSRYKCIGADGNDWIQHNEALLRVIRVHGLPFADPSIRRLFYNDWQLRLFHINLLLRRRVGHARSASSQTAAKKSSFLRNCALRVPDLIEQADRMLKAVVTWDEATPDPFPLLISLGNTIAALKRWHLRWTSELRPRFRYVSMKTFKEFHSLSGDQSTTFKSAYTFTVSTFESEFRVNIIAQLELEQSIMDIHAAYPTLLGQIPELRMQLSIIAEDAKLAADTLCMLVPWNARPQNGSLAAINCSALLHYASTFYGKQGCNRELVWCQQVSSALSQRYGISMEHGALTDG